MNNYRNDFPLLSRKINGKGLIYFDNAATTPRPQQVIKAVTDHYQNHSGNPGRGTHTLSLESSRVLEEGRKKVLKFLHASPEEYVVIFTKNTTESLNLAAHILNGKSVITTVSEHHSNFLPWQNKQVIGVTEKGTINLSEIKTKEGEVLAVTHGSNVTGNITDLAAIVSIARERHLITVIDAAQTIAHEEVNLTETSVDFFAFSAHKLYGPEGVGVLVMKKHYLTAEPMILGGGAVDKVTTSTVLFKHNEERFEAGTPNTAGVAGLLAALEYVTSIGIKEIKKKETELLEHCLQKALTIPQLKIVGSVTSDKRTPLVSFTLGNIHPHDIADFLDSEGIAIRAGYHCAEPLHAALRTGPTVRVSFSFFNEKQEIDSLFTVLDICIQKFA
ncbi:aminotransferase class V-fold PLP-dependent enzyme [bacterium]|nr:aminotransferase class V-fold PLP-dependent enzyme [bacterium]